MVHGHIPVNGIARQLRGTEQHFQVHHIVDDDRIFPSVAVVVPRADAFHLRAVAGNQSLGTLQHHILVRAFTRQFIRLSKAVVHHKAEVVRALVPLGFFNRPGPRDGSPAPVIIMRIGIYLPQRAGEEPRAPIVGMYHSQRTVFMDAARHDATPGSILLLFLCFVGALHGKFQLFAGKGIGVIHFGGLHIEQVEAVFPLNDSVGFG